MYNAQLPKENELPSSTQLLISTFAAVAFATVILFVAVLPAEYGIDHTGLGAKLGLTQMGEIKSQLAQEAEQDAQQAIQETVVKQVAPPKQEMQVETPELNSANAETTAQMDDVAINIPSANTADTEIAKSPANSETTKVTLAPGEAAEIKLAMSEGNTVSYDWAVDIGHVNYDTHGDKPGTRYYNYTKGKAVKGDKGELTAAFDGKHGWFWRNRSTETVTVTLLVSGQFTEVVRVL
jgi:hypothetical protein